MSSPAIVNVSKFVSGNAKKFGEYVNYIDRHEAVRSNNFSKFNVNAFDGYHNYMENPEKSTGLFTATQTQLSNQEKEQLKKAFQLAQTNDSIMWQDVISFDNKFLEEQGIYRARTGYLNEGVLQEAVRKGMAASLKAEGMEASGVWAASIHLNTDNIHVHIALVEPHPTKPYKTFINKQGKSYTARKGSRKQGTLDLMKSTVVNDLISRDKELMKISELIHSRIAPANREIIPLMSRPMRQLMNEVYQELPDDLRLWKYNNQAITGIRSKLDVLTTMYMEEYYPEERIELTEALNEQVATTKRLYGDGEKEKGRYEKYKSNKENELYAKVGNVLLREMRGIRKEEKQHYEQSVGDKREPFTPKNLQPAYLNKLKKALRKDFDSIKNKKKYQELQEEMERGE
ncbi:hypothetical protein HB904_17215 [Listeria booriae]|uniref:Relaxase n=1 Tax=Listeria booriae TaxID=1552123 RepID=A0A842AQA5_9LIST|nr:MobP2 family relaxase [Listeria booriae]MBC1403123.1 hypothetical protein [Listeria booriae]MBC1617921.1 hypothetical protein [Listeria booriae]